ncbi:MAG TPA: hypothetical protein VKO18_02305 [Terriglobia bacterium]|nr:hypothetical protein [Terriglobia bacterium]
MSLEVQIQEVNAHLSIKAVGQYSLANLHDLFTRLKDESENRADRGVILDITEVAGAIPVLDMLVLGEYCSKYWKQAFKVAIITPVGGLNRFFENGARNRGVQIAVVPNQGAAMEWLK